MDELEKGHTTKKACQKASIDIRELYQWLEKGINGDERFGEFVKVYKKEYLIPIKKAYARGLNENVKEKDILKTMKRHDFIVNEDYKQLKKLNLYPKPEDVTLEMDEDFEIKFKK